MATKLTDSNYKAICGKVKTQGFDVSFWREYRSGVCKGKGVGKAMTKLKDLGVGPKGGLENKPDYFKMDELLLAYRALEVAIRKSFGACGGAHKHTKAFCQAYLDQLKKAPAYVKSQKEKAAGAANLAFRKELTKLMGLCKASYYSIDGLVGEFEIIQVDLRKLRDKMGTSKEKSQEMKDIVAEFSKQRKFFAARQKKFDEHLKQANSLKEPVFADADTKKQIKLAETYVKDSKTLRKQVDKAIGDSLKMMKITQQTIKGMPKVA